MKKVILILFMAFLPAALLAQEKPDDSKEQQDKDKQKTENMIMPQPGGKDMENLDKAQDMKDKKMGQGMKHERFIDADGDGINDMRPPVGPEGKMPPKFKKKKVEPFSDKDGDGINDNRAKGMGWQGKGKDRGFGKH